MQLKKIAINNFRLLHDVEILLEAQTTVIVGRNNSGKTSLTEVMNRLFDAKRTTFRFEDFSFCSHHRFWQAYAAHKAGTADAEIRTQLPAIEVRLTFSYGADEPLGLLSEFVIDLSPDCTDALVIVRFTLGDGDLAALFAELPEPEEKNRNEFFATIGERVARLYKTSIVAADPNDPGNAIAIEAPAFKALCASGFIGAHRGLDDSTQKDRVVIGKVLEKLFTTAQGNADDTESHTTAKELEAAVKDVQTKIGTDFNQKLDALLPALTIFGYPGLADPKLLTQTILDVSALLTGHTKILYTGTNGVHLPEGYNGLGMRNIILILLQLREFYKGYAATTPKPAVHVVFIEEPEVHLHPQMQEVFIRKLNEIAGVFGKEGGSAWPVQFIVSTHSSHVANEAHFETIRYFHSINEPGSGIPKASIKDLRQGLAGKGEPERSFLHQYMTLTRCDLFFADKAILIEGTTERLLLPKMIHIVDADQPAGKKLGNQYISTIEIGGAYAHIFFDLLEFLDLRALIITDIDSVKPNAGNRLIACPVNEGTKTSNACLKALFGNDVAPSALIVTADSAKVAGKRRIAFQVPHEAGGPCGRSFEDAFMLANPDLFPSQIEGHPEREMEAWLAAQEVKKSEFALRHALGDAPWITPRYIREGLVWLADTDETPVPAPVAAVAL